ncbi:retinitis pigmentosa 1-like 1 protein [Penaeus chinensis]|uniref:retinitis pigmentosa 1-like 1 protein n=1 Tax=Penaeus chinensis TaxID=139456 RepID=UPI001FB8012F|nr:retinitis pigmentosa 1-like 1 protein [Penaeus chinensis]
MNLKLLMQMKYNLVHVRELPKMPFFLTLPKQDTKEKRVAPGESSVADKESPETEMSETEDKESPETEMSETEDKESPETEMSETEGKESPETEMSETEVKESPETEMSETEDEEFPENEMSKKYASLEMLNKLTNPYKMSLPFGATYPVLGKIAEDVESKTGISEAEDEESETGISEAEDEESETGISAASSWLNPLKSLWFLGNSEKKSEIKNTENKDNTGENYRSSIWSYIPFFRKKNSQENVPEKYGKNTERTPNEVKKPDSDEDSDGNEVDDGTIINPRQWGTLRKDTTLSEATGEEARPKDTEEKRVAPGKEGECLLSTDESSYESSLEYETAESNDESSSEAEDMESETGISEAEDMESETGISEAEDMESETGISEAEDMESETGISEAEDMESETAISETEDKESPENEMSETEDKESPKKEMSETEGKESPGNEMSEAEDKESETGISEAKDVKSETGISEAEDVESEIGISETEAMESETGISEAEDEKSESGISESLWFLGNSEKKSEIKNTENKDNTGENYRSSIWSYIPFFRKKNSQENVPEKYGKNTERTPNEVKKPDSDEDSDGNEVDDGTIINPRQWGTLRKDTTLSEATGEEARPKDTEEKRVAPGKEGECLLSTDESSYESSLEYETAESNDESSSEEMESETGFFETEDKESPENEMSETEDKESPKKEMSETEGKESPGNEIEVLKAELKAIQGDSHQPAMTEEHKAYLSKALKPLMCRQHETSSEINNTRLVEHKRFFAKIRRAIGSPHEKWESLDLPFEDDKELSQKYARSTLSAYVKLEAEKRKCLHEHRKAFIKDQTDEEFANIDLDVMQLEVIHQIIMELTQLNNN